MWGCVCKISDQCRGLDFLWPSTYQQTYKQTSVRQFIYIYIQLRYPALSELICNLLNIFYFVNSFQKCVLQLLGFQAPEAQGVRGHRSNLDQNLHFFVQNFIEISAGVWISISPPHTNRQTNKHLFAHLYIYI